ncbi:MAG: transglutaminase TgpA family protein [Gammaproteobacteria bacterium]
MTRQDLSTREVCWLGTTVLLCLVPHLGQIPGYLAVAFGGAALWRLLGAGGILPLPERRRLVLWLTVQFLAICAFLSVYIAHRGQIGREAGLELLAALLGLKLLEMQTRRDYYLVILLCFFLVATRFFLSQTPVTAGFALLLVVLIVTVLIQFNTPVASRDPRQMLALGARLTAQSLPLMVLAFILFPRLPGPLWGLPHDARNGVTGLSDELTLGQITHLGAVDELVFRAEFVGPIPRAKDLYWRGPVLWRTDGRTWRSEELRSSGATRLEQQGQIYAYHVTLEPHNKRWLFGLDRVTSTERDIRRTEDGRLWSRSPVEQRRRYLATSAVNYRALGLPPAERAAALQMPGPRWHPRTRSLAAELARDASGPLDVAEKALAYYRANNFSYTLTPAAVAGDAVDAFLFETREGFCEHFAASFVVLMRAAGVPARIVTGYQGGEYNGLGSFFEVRQYDAHAWAEIYDEQQGWVRVDPTGSVVPGRIAMDLVDARELRSEGRQLARASATPAALRGLGRAFDVLTHQWNQWVIGYSSEQQSLLLQQLGMVSVDRRSLILILGVSLIVMTAILAFFVLRFERKKVADPVQAAWLQLCARLARTGLTRAAHEPALAFAARVAAERREIAAEFSALAEAYTQARYGSAKLDPRPFIRRARALRVRRPA